MTLDMLAAARAATGGGELSSGDFAAALMFSTQRVDATKARAKENLRGLRNLQRLAYGASAEPPVPLCSAAQSKRAGQPRAAVHVRSGAAGRDGGGPGGDEGDCCLSAGRRVGCCL